MVLLLILGVSSLSGGEQSTVASIFCFGVVIASLVLMAPILFRTAKQAQELAKEQVTHLPRPIHTKNISLIHFTLR